MFQFGMIVDLIIGYVIIGELILFCLWSFFAWSSHGGQSSIRVTRTRPREKEDGLIGMITTDYSYYDGRGSLPVGFGTTPEREKPETSEAYKDRIEEDHQKETGS